MIRHLPLACLTAALVMQPALAGARQVTVHKVIIKDISSKGGLTKIVSTGDPAARALISSCGERRFETQAEVTDSAGRKRVTRIKLCAKPGQDSASWIKTLRSAQATIRSSTTLPPEARTQIVAALQTEIARVEAEGSGEAAPAAPATPK